MMWLALIAHWQIDRAFWSVVGVVVLCILAQGFFSGSELAMVSCDRLRLKQRRQHGAHGAKLAQYFVNKPAKLFSITLLGTNLCVVTASTVTTLYLISHFGPAYGSFALLLSPIILVCAEIVPKSIFYHHADRLVDRVAPVLQSFGVVMYPVVWGLRRLTDRLLGDVRRAAGAERRIAREELVAILQGEETRGTDIRQSERTMAARVLRLADFTAKNIMRPLITLQTLPVTATRDDALSIFELQGNAWIPIFDDRVFNVIGVLESSDVLCATKDQPLRELVHQPVYVPQNMRVNDLFRVMRNRHERAAVVVDEYGATIGLVTLEDICEEVVGDIRDEFAFDEQLFRVLGPHHFCVKARMEIEVAQSTLGVEIPRGPYETVAGFLLHHCGHLPQVGETIHIGAWEYHIRQVSDRAILEVEVRKTM